VFCGPSLPASDRVHEPGVTYLAPAARGDVERAARTYDDVLLIDGVFHHDLAPSPKECYTATRFARMYGASSMGALRAVECAPYGFTPLGIIARWFSCGAVDGDDEVAVLAHPQTHEALSVPLVNVRYALRALRRSGAISADEEADAVARARDVYYMDRTWSDVAEILPARARDAFETVVKNGADLKGMDARFALRTVLRARMRSNDAWLPSSLPKSPGTYDRAVPFAQTLALLPQLRERYGITRVADTTYLDRTGVPTYSAMVPHSSDVLGVYNGKGMTREGAIASAVMEASERQIGASLSVSIFEVAVSEIAERLDLAACGMREDRARGSVPCVLGTDLLSGERLAVPVALVQCPYYGPKLFDTTTSNGLASGNNLTEAIYHALCELIERHAWAIYHTRCSIAPRFYTGRLARDRALTPNVVLPCGDPVVDALVANIEHAGLIVRAMYLDEQPLPPTVIATVTEPGSSPPMAHLGLGCSLSPAHALTRALTEAVQSRVTDIQAAREDILRSTDPAGNLGEHARRPSALPTDQWYFRKAEASVSLSSIEDRSSNDLAADLRCVLDALRRYGLARAVIVDLSPRDLPVCVVRAIVPGLETFMFTGHVGARMRAELNPFAVRTIA
jgi:ribosomal protein S12 methylthiotransferase accessory factor